MKKAELKEKEWTGSGIKAYVASKKITKHSGRVANVKAEKREYEGVEYATVADSDMANIRLCGFLAFLIS